MRITNVKTEHWVEACVLSHLGINIFLSCWSMYLSGLGSGEQGLVQISEELPLSPSEQLFSHLENEWMASHLSLSLTVSGALCSICLCF